MPWASTENDIHCTALSSTDRRRRHVAGTLACEVRDVLPMLAWCCSWAITSVGWVATMVRMNSGYEGLLNSSCHPGTHSSDPAPPTTPPATCNPTHPPLGMTAVHASHHRAPCGMHSHAWTGLSTSSAHPDCRLPLRRWRLSIQRFEGEHRLFSTHDMTCTTRVPGVDSMLEDRAQTSFDAWWLARAEYTHHTPLTPYATCAETSCFDTC